MHRQPHSYAFFDFDGTLINIKSMLSFLEYYSKIKFKSCHFYDEFMSKASRLQTQGCARSDLNTLYYQHFAGSSYTELLELGDEWYEQEIINKRHRLITHTIRILEQHRYMGDTVVLVTGSMWPLLRRFCEDYRIKDALYAELTCHGDTVTGALEHGPIISEGKAKAISRYLKHQKVPASLEQCYAYGDHISDLSMLEMVGHPVVVSGDPELETIADDRDWSLLWVHNTDAWYAENKEQPTHV
ncbi:HAD family hydrolase [Hahella ganghwensis]|uniref:HAD family hydrolase n=1 Tax=Hahella ganghwensis TaxID=286420 RepID=UPI00247FEBE4|nr:HAD-IB family hydrolase [Hahella ganghwensis]